MLKPQQTLIEIRYKNDAEIHDFASKIKVDMLVDVTAVC